MKVQSLLCCLALAKAEKESCSDGTCAAARDNSLLQAGIVHVKKHAQEQVHEQSMPGFTLHAEDKYCKNNRAGHLDKTEEQCRELCASEASCGFFAYYHGRPFQNKRCWIISADTCQEQGTGYKPTKIWRKLVEGEQVTPPTTTTFYVMPPAPAVDYTLEHQNKFCGNDRSGHSASSEQACKEACSSMATCGYIVYYHGRPFQNKRCWIISSERCDVRGTSYKPTKIWKKPEDPNLNLPLPITPEPPLGLSMDIEVDVVSAKRASKHFYEAMRFWDGQGRRSDEWSLGRDRCKPDCRKSQINPNLRLVMNVGHRQQTRDEELFNFKWGPKWEYFNGGYCNELVYYFLAMSGFGAAETPRGWPWLPTLWNCENEGTYTQPGGRVEAYCGYSSRGRNWAVWGNDATSDPQPGDVVALACNGADPNAATKGTSHTTYFWMKDPSDPNKYWTLGGNQPATNAKWYPRHCFSFIRRSGEVDRANSGLATSLLDEGKAVEADAKFYAQAMHEDQESEDSSEGDKEGGDEEQEVLQDQAEFEPEANLQQLNSTRDDWQEPTYYGYSKQWRGEYWYNFDPSTDTLSFPAGAYRLELRNGATYSSQSPRQNQAFHMYRLMPSSHPGNHRADTVVYFITMAPGQHLQSLRLVPTGAGREKLAAA